MVDVGGVYDPSKHRYDHHQRGFNEVFGNGFNTKLSSAGLTYKLVYSTLPVGRHIDSVVCLLQTFWKGNHCPANGL